MKNLQHSRMASALAARENHDRPWRITTPAEFIEEHLLTLQRDEAVFHHTEFTVDELRGVLCEPIASLTPVNLGTLYPTTDDGLKLLTAAEHPTKENPGGILKTWGDRIIALQKQHHVPQKHRHGIPYNHLPLSPLSTFALRVGSMSLTPEDSSAIEAWAELFNVKIQLVLQKETSGKRISFAGVLQRLPENLKARLNIL